MLRLGLAASFLCASVTSYAASGGGQLAGRIDPVVQDVMQRTGTPGVTIEVVQGGHVVYSHAYGFRDLKGRIPADVDTYYEAGSITKQFTAAAILQLKEAGKLDIDVKLATYLPAAPHASEVSLRQLLSHTSGLPEYFDGPDVETAAGKPTSFDQVMARVAGKPLDFAPGAKWAYSNTGYILLGRVIETVSHETYHHYIQTHLLDRAGMKQTFTMADEKSLPDMALGYRRAEGQVRPAPPVDEGFAWSAGDIVTTPGDLQRWNEALTSGKIVTPADYAVMTTPVITRQGDSGYGFGLFIDSIDDQPRIGHTGSSLGFTAANEYFPKQDVRIIAFTDLVDDPEPGERFTTAIFEALFPEIAAAAARPSPGEDTSVTAKARTLFAEMQSGTEDGALLGDKLAGKMKAGLAKRLADEFAPYGPSTAFIFKGHRSDSGLDWFDYLIKFGPGSSLKFSVGFDSIGKITSLGFG
jgi:D-alanyl-D-alanine carboxypeptidase